MIHVVFLISALLVIFGAMANSAHVQAQEYGQQSLLFTILGQEQELIEDVGVPINQIASNTENISQESGIEIDDSEEDSSENMLSSSLALVKSDIVNPEGINRTKIEKYIVQNGDTLSVIAKRYKVSVNTLLWANNLKINSPLKPGTTLTILPVTGVAHTVKKGETLSSIAKQYKTEAKTIADYNHTDQNGLVVGDILIIPNGQIVAAPVVKPVVIRQPAKPTSPTPTYPAYQYSGDGEMIWPTSCKRITQYFRGSRHTGLDIACGMGAPLYAADNGTVISVIYGRTGYGYHIIINHGNGKYTLYGHASKIYVEPGQIIERGQLIAAMGSTGRSTGPHLHFEVRLNGSQGTRVNPLSYIR